MESMFDKLVKMVGDLGKRMDAEISAVCQETSLISASVKNVQTQILDKQGRFDTHDASSFGKPATPGHKLQFPKYDGSDDPITWLHIGEQFFRAYGTPEHLKVPTPHGTIVWRKTRAFRRGVSSSTASTGGSGPHCVATPWAS